MVDDERTWKCPECGDTVDIGYDWLAEHGGPVCEECDCDMGLQEATEETATEIQLSSQKNALLDALTNTAAVLDKLWWCGCRRAWNRQGSWRW